MSTVSGVLFNVEDEGGIMLVSIRGVSGVLQVLADIMLESDTFEMLEKPLEDEGEFAETIVKGLEVDPGKIKDVFDKAKKLRKLILTKKGIVAFYEKGIFSKTVNFLVFPLKYAKSVEEKSVLGSRWISLEYYVPIDEKKPLCFKLRIVRLKKQNRDKLLRELNLILEEYNRK